MVGIGKCSIGAVKGTGEILVQEFMMHKATLAFLGLKLSTRNWTKVWRVHS